MFCGNSRKYKGILKWILQREHFYWWKKVLPAYCHLCNNLKSHFICEQRRIILFLGMAYLLSFMIKTKVGFYKIIRNAEWSETLKYLYFFNLCWVFSYCFYHIYPNIWDYLYCKYKKLCCFFSSFRIVWFKPYAESINIHKEMFLFCFVR